mmetsp:Transcript_21014/g.62723  ORF Transcript_21014/g.62723 Transcript_21014/m.62723 type:complete len:207 (-) Transcript_21014:9-629(-)
MRCGAGASPPNGTGCTITYLWSRFTPVAAPSTNCTRGFAPRTLSVIDLYSTVPTAAEANIGVKTKWFRGLTTTTRYLFASTTLMSACEAQPEPRTTSVARSSSSFRGPTSWASPSDRRVRWSVASSSVSSARSTSVVVASRRVLWGRVVVCTSAAAACTATHSRRSCMLGHSLAGQPNEMRRMMMVLGDPRILILEDCRVVCGQSR